MLRIVLCVLYWSLLRLATIKANFTLCEVAHSLFDFLRVTLNVLKLIRLTSSDCASVIPSDSIGTDTLSFVKLPVFCFSETSSAKLYREVNYTHYNAILRYTWCPRWGSTYVERQKILEGWGVLWFVPFLNLPTFNKNRHWVSESNRESEPRLERAVVVRRFTVVCVP